MAEEEALKRIEARLTRLESALAQGSQAAAGVSIAAPGGAVVDPAPWGPWRPLPISTPVVSQPPIGTIGDPAPWGPWRPLPISAPPMPPVTVSDPAPWGPWRPLPISTPVVSQPPVGTIGDPPPVDIGRLSLSQLESVLHNIAAERARLDANEGMIKERIATLKEHG